MAEGIADHFSQGKPSEVGQRNDLEGTLGLVVHKIVVVVEEDTPGGLVDDMNQVVVVDTYLQNHQYINYKIDQLT